MFSYLEAMDYYGLPRGGIIHVGANDAKEAKGYDRYGKVPVAFFEPVPNVYQLALRNTAPFPLQRVYHACCTDVDGDEVTFNVASNQGQSSSIFPLGRNAETVPNLRYTKSFAITTSRVETILTRDYPPYAFNLAVIDTQGADLLVLKGFGRVLDHLDAIEVEVADRPMYQGGATFDEIYRWLDARGFALAKLDTVPAGWGNAFFIRREPVHLREARAAVSIGKPAAMSSVWNNRGAALGNDGDVDNRKKFFHSEREAQPWWRVDLGAPTAIRRVVLFDRIEQRERAESLVLEVGDDDAAYTEIHRRAPGKPIRECSVVDWRGTARYVRVRLADGEFLHLRQVAVIAEDAA